MMSKAKLPIVSALILLVAGCGPSKEDEAIAAVKAAAQEQLRDPASAQFTDIRTRPGPGAGVKVCGEVNSKNGFGGYAGKQKFQGIYAEGMSAAAVDLQEAATLVDKEVFDKRVDDLCS